MRRVRLLPVPQPLPEASDIAGFALPVRTEHGQIAQAWRSDSENGATESAGPYTALLLTETSHADPQKLVIEVIRLAAAFGSEQIQVRPQLWGMEETASSFAERHELITAGMRGIQTLAEDLAVDVVLDLTGDLSLVRPAEAARFIDELAGSAFGLSLDLAQAPVDENFTDWVTTLAHRLRAVRGELSEDMMACLVANNFEGLIIEPSLLKEDSAG